ncbi:hypothetical protein BC941DRAFT_417643 [Chlamydoabsidia padenii]|nr:hypothetical protein BC941DRAFT_417643 [Chlamydoabsidia padenii]
MQLYKLFTSLAITLVSSSLFVQADPVSDLESIHQLFKREDKLPFDSLPAGNCTAPAACTNIAQPATCRCNDVLTVCQNTQGQFCWGSRSLNQNSGCPSAPSPCSNSFVGNASCLCNSQAVLCVDQHNHYCYGNINNGNSVSLAAIPTGSQPVMSSSSVSSGAPSNPPLAGSQTGTADAQATATPSFATQLSVSTQQLGYIMLMILGLISFVSMA